MPSWDPLPGGEEKGWVRKVSRFRYARFGFLCAAVCAVVIGAWLSGCRADPRRPRWNILLVTMDTTRADRLGCYGYRRAETPVIDALARGGIRYERCYSPIPLTLPAHCSLFTGLVPPRHGVRDNGRTALPAQAETLAEILSGHGYATAAVIGAFVLDSQFGLDQGFDQYGDDLSQGTEPGRFHFAERNAELVTDAALDWWQGNRGEPKFMWVHYFDPHSPYAPPGFDPAFAAKTPYDAEISYVDAQLGRLLAAVEAAAGGDETLVVVTSDHGEALGEHGEFTHGLFVYDCTLRVPLLVRFPDRRHAGTVIQTPVALVDVMPAVLGWLGVNVPAGLDGVSLPLSEEDTASVASGDRAIYFENRRLVQRYGWSPLAGIVAGDSKFIRAPRPELYDLAADPSEERSLFAPGDARSKRMSARFGGLLAEVAEKQVLAVQEANLTAEDLAKLRSLGYAGGGTSRRDTSEVAMADLPDPKDMMDVYVRLMTTASLLVEDRTSEAAELLIGVVDGPDPNSPRAIHLLTTLLDEETEVRESVIACLQSVIRRPEQPGLEAYVPGRLGLALMADERYEEAIEAFERSLQIQPRNAAGHRRLGEIHERLGRREEAVGAYRRALELVDTLAQPPEWAEKVRGKLKE